MYLPFNFKLTFDFLVIFVCILLDDGLDSHRGAFSTADADNDGSGAKNCAAELNGGWWHKKCNTYDSFLNGVYSPTRPAALNKGIKWTPWTGLTDSLKGCEMMIRP